VTFVVVREVRSIYPTLPIVIASGQGREELRKLLKEMASITFVNKPYSSEELKTAIRAIGIRCQWRKALGVRCSRSGRVRCHCRAPVLSRHDVDRGHDFPRGCLMYHVSCARNGS
jgi:DNA-binding response OmpR family regulator